MTQYFKQNSIWVQAWNLVKHQIPLPNFSGLNVFIFKTSQVFSILFVSHCWRKLLWKKCRLLFWVWGELYRPWGWPRFRLFPVTPDCIHTSETAREKMPTGGLSSLLQCLQNTLLSFLVILPGPAPCLSPLIPRSWLPLNSCPRWVHDFLLFFPRMPRF